VMNISNSLRGITRPSTVQESPGRKKSLLDFPPLRRLLFAIYNQIFKWYFDRH
jgi:hypothetical protein